ncbi:MAG: nucleoside triphosphate pyrophosphatase [Lacipirellulaceae bacterium]
MSSHPIVLASSSPQRQRLLTDAGFAFQIIPPRDGAESGICTQCGPAELVTELAQSKASDVAAQIREATAQLSDDALLIACDTVAECQGQILGKPTSEDHAADMLRRLRGTVHRVYSGLTLANCSSRGELSEVDTRLAVSELRMDDLSDESLDEYMESGLWRAKAGAIGYQDRVGWLHLLKGSESNVIGLPMELLSEMLASRRPNKP